jgi:hypothetical protein
MPSNFSLASIVPEHDTFTDLDGKEYNVRSVREFSAIEMTEVARLERKVRKAQKRVEDSAEIEDDEQSDKSLYKAQDLLTDAINGIVAILVPKLPEERVREIDFAYKFHFMEWWKNQQPQAPAADPNVNGGSLTPVSSSPASSVSIVSTQSAF